MSKFSPGKNIGYLGGGQLARMLAESASHLGCYPHVLSPKKNDPGAQVSGFWHQGQLTEKQDLVDFLKKVDVATFESEFLDARLLQDAQATTGTTIYPAPALMGLLQDRKSQKELLDQFLLPTAPWSSVAKADEILHFVERNAYPIVFKKRFFGYDGYGTFIIKNKKALADFIKQEFKPNLFIVEKFIPFKKEMAVIVARSEDKSFTSLPFVESFQQDARCDWVRGPIKFKESKNTLSRLKKFLNGLKYVGVMGVEFFLTSKGLMVNEIAPRVHNTGHYSLDTDSLSQFDLHNMCLLGQKLPKKIEIKKGFAMANLIGSGDEVLLKSTHGKLYWYGKDDNRPGRKMGHLNALGTTPAAALKEALKRRREIKL